MWKVENRTAYAAERTWIRDRSGAHCWVVAVRATFTLREEGSLILADEQVAPVELPVYTGVPGLSSLRYEADLGPLKPATEVMVLGSAYAPLGRPAPRVLAELRIESRCKRIAVFGERLYQSGTGSVRVSNPNPFVRQALCYEVAFGGRDATDPDLAAHIQDERNPIGRGFAKSARALDGQPAHQLEFPGKRPAETGPACFGPICSYWSPRRLYAGTYDSSWERNRKPLVPENYNDRFTLCAPQDQQLDSHLRGGERIELINMNPSGRLAITLPRIELSCSTWIHGRTERHGVHLVSVIIEPDDARLSLVYQSALMVHWREADYLDVTEVREE